MNAKSKKTWNSAVVLIAAMIFILAGCAPLTADASSTLAAVQQGVDPAAAAAGLSSQISRLDLKGSVDEIGSDFVVVNGQRFRYDDQSVVVSALRPGDRVQVQAVLLPDRTRYAQIVKLDLSGSNQAEFKFYGLVEAMDASLWVISGNEVGVEGSTAISTGIKIGSFVEVEGRVQSGQLVARKIQLEDSDDSQKTPAPGSEIEFFGTVESVAAGQYVISGRTVRTTTATEIKGSLLVGDRVKVHATQQADGSYLAREIERSIGDDAANSNDDTGNLNSNNNGNTNSNTNSNSNGNNNGNSNSNGNSNGNNNDNDNDDDDDYGYGYDD